MMHGMEKHRVSGGLGKDTLIGGTANDDNDDLTRRAA